MHRPMKNCKSLLLALTVSIMPALAQDIQITATTEAGQPKYAQRIRDLTEQVKLVKSKSLITDADETKFLERLAQLKTQEEETRKGGFQKPASDDLEKAITALNADVFKASHKSNPIKPGQADKEVNDPNLIPAYPDANLQPGSGQVDKKK